MCVCVENSKITWLHSAKKRRKNCWNVEIGLRLSWILNDERAAKRNRQGSGEEGKGATGLVAGLIQFECEVATAKGCHAGHAAPWPLLFDWSQAVFSPSLSLSLFEARGLLRVPACLGWWGVGRKGSFLPWPRPEGSNSLANTRKINQQQRRRRKKQLGNNVVNFLSW